MHRLGVGIAAFERHEQSKRSFAELSNELSTAQIENLNAQLSQFRSALTHFAINHRDSIRSDSAFRHAFQQMCSSIGVDPLAGPRKGGWWAELLNLGDWQYELGVQIVDICVSTRDRNGGMIELSELLRLVRRLRAVSDQSITEDDVVRSIKTLQPLGAGYQVVTIGGRKMVSSVIKELDEDQVVLVSVAQEKGGRIVEQDLIQRHNWTRDRAKIALENMLLRDGLCWLDEQDEQSGRAYWVPSSIKWDV